MFTSASTLEGTQASLYTSMTRLGTGKSINSAADNPAGLAISELMKADTAQFSVRARELANNKNYAQTAEGGLNSANTIVKRMSALASQATTGTTNSVGRQILDNEFQQLKSELSAISERTRSAVPQGIAEVDDALADFDAAIASLDTVDLSSFGNAAAALTALEDFQKETSGAQADIGAKMNVYDSQVSELNTRVENLTSSYSRIADTDYGTESTNKAVADVRMQAYISMLKMGNETESMKLKLLEV